MGPTRPSYLLPGGETRLAWAESNNHSLSSVQPAALFAEDRPRVSDKHQCSPECSRRQARSQFITPQTPRTFHLSHLHHLFTRAGSCLASFRTPGASRQPAGIGTWKCSLETHHGPRRQSFKRERRHACPPLLSGIYRYLSPPRATTSHQHSGCPVTTRTVTTTSLHLPPPPLPNLHPPPPSPSPPSTSLSPFLTTTRSTLPPLLKHQSHAHDLIVHSFPMPDTPRSSHPEAAAVTA